MMAAEADIIRYIITGEDGEVIPENATHVSVHPSVKVISLRLFESHQNIVELICHDGVIKIKVFAFGSCSRLKRVIMNGVEEVERNAFEYCEALEYVECDKLEIIGEGAFGQCESITGINLPSAKIVRESAFWVCPALVDAKFGRKLESIGGNVFYYCPSLERITIPLKNGLIDHNNAFQHCENLRHIDLVDREVLQRTAEALLCEEWKDDMNAEIASINQILPHAYAGDALLDEGEKANVIRQWIRNVLRNIIDYKSQHRRLLKEAESRLQLALPHDIVINNVVPFITLPPHTFDGEEEIVERNDKNENIGKRYSFNLDSNGENDEDNYDDSQEGTTVIAVEGGKQEQEGANYEERRKRQRTETNNGTM